MRAVQIIVIMGFLVGCTQEVVLKNLAGKDVAKGELRYEGNSSGYLVLKKDGVVYRGRWEAKKVDESAVIAKSYGIGSRQYREYQQDRSSYLKSGESNLKSDGGETLNCQFKYRGSNAQGVCTSESETFSFMVKS